VWSTTVEVLLVASLFVLALGLVYGPFSASLAHVRASCAAADLDDDLLLTRTVSALMGTQGRVVLPENERERVYLLKFEFTSADGSERTAEAALPVELPYGVGVRRGDSSDGTITFGKTGRLSVSSRNFTLVEKGGRERPYGVSAQTGRLYER